MIAFVTHNPKMVEVRMDGAFAGWLSKESRRTGGLHSERFSWWEGTIGGKPFKAETLTLAKSRVRAAFADAPVEDTASPEDPAAEDVPAPFAP